MASSDVLTRTSHNFSKAFETMQPTLEMVAAHALLSATPLPVDDESRRPSVDFAEAESEQAPQDDFPVIQRRPRSDSAGLDALANLASLEQSKEVIAAAAPSRPQVHFLVSNEEELEEEDDEEHDSDESEAMPPPPPRVRRRRSASNPEGMDKWDPHEARLAGRRHFVLPASILEEELAEVSEAMKKQSAQRKSDAKSSKRGGGGPRESKNQLLANDQRDDDVDEASLTPDELLRRARSRLLEDLSYNLNGDKGEMTLPHTLEKYQDIYNMNGRIGIYTAAERAAIIARFQRKRSRRVWNKKIRYGCRKSLADRRLRVKGRFVKRSEQEQLARALAAKLEGVDDKGSAEEEEDEDEDKDMFDVDDPDAGFSPTEDSPYRRVRRHTIT